MEEKDIANCVKDYANEIARHAAEAKTDLLKRVIYAVIKKDGLE